MKDDGATRKSEPTALITNIQRFSLHDGPGVRTTFFFKGCSLRCLWCANPESLEPEPELYFSKKKCISCGACAAACPDGCIVMADGFPKIERGCKCFDSALACPSTALTKVGQRYRISELLDKALADKAFYDESGGGITASGGDPMLQSEAVMGLFKLAQGEGLHTALETEGNVPWSSFEKVLPYCDLVMFDVKHADDAVHRHLTGKGTRVIHRNLRTLADVKANVLLRAPMIPGYNMDEDSIGKLIEFIGPLKLPVELLPFHQLGQSKYEAVGLEYTLKGKKPPKKHDIEAVIDRMRQSGIEVIYKS